MNVQTESCESFDVIVIGGGINGTSALRELAGAGYRVLLAEQGDFAHGASSRSSRILHCGLRYFETPAPLRTFLLAPRRLGGAIRMARAAMLARSELAERAPERLRPFTMCFPLYRGDPIKGWHMDMGMAMLRRMAPGGPGLDYVRHRDPARHLPFHADLRNPARLESVATYREYIIDWPDRLCVDAALQAERLGAQLRLFTRATVIDRGRDGCWQVELQGGEGACVVRAPVILNLAGTWIDDVLASVPGSTRDPLVRGTKGAHVMVRLPDRYRGYGITALNRLGMPIYCLPMRDDLYCIGPTETLFDGDAGEVFATDDDIAFLIAEANHLLPGLALTTGDVRFSWAGVRPLTHEPQLPMGGRVRKIHDLSDRGMAGMLSLTAGPVMSHLSAGRELLAAVRKLRAPSGPAKTPPALPMPQADEEAWRHAVRHEHARDLAGILQTRLGAGWGRHLNRAELERAADAVANLLGWDDAEKARQVEAFLHRQSTLFHNGRSPGMPEATQQKILQGAEE